MDISIYIESYILYWLEILTTKRVRGVIVYEKKVLQTGEARELKFCEKGSGTSYLTRLLYQEIGPQIK